MTKRRLRHDTYAWWEYALMAVLALVVVAGAVLLVWVITTSDSGPVAPERPAASELPVACTEVEWRDPDLGTCVPRTVCATGEVYDERTNTCALPAPRPAAVRPRSGPAEGGTEVAITGFDFQRGATVTLGGAPVTDITVVSSSEITAITPPGTVFFPVDIQVTNPDGQTGELDNGFTYDEPVIKLVTGVVPDTGSTQGGEAVVIEGRDFEDGAVVSFFGRPATGVEVLSPSKIRATIPPAPEGVVSVNVRNPGRDPYTLKDAFTYVDQEPRVVTRVRPAKGVDAGGTEITVIGSGFADGAEVLIGGQPARKVEVVDSTLIRAVAPPGEVGPADVAVRNPGVPAAILPEGFTYLQGATITEVTPVRGPLDGGTRVTISGTGFLEGAVVTVGDVAVEDARVVDESTIRFVMPAGDRRGVVAITVTNPDQPGVTVKRAFTYTRPTSATPVFPESSPSPSPQEAQ